jgi:hypothetical protein
MYIYNHVSLISSENEKYFRQELYIISKNTVYAQHFSLEKHAVYEIMWKNIVRARQATDDKIMLGRKGAICIPDN